MDAFSSRTTALLHSKAADCNYIIIMNKKFRLLNHQKKSDRNNIHLVIRLNTVKKV